MDRPSAAGLLLLFLLAAFPAAVFAVAPTVDNGAAISVSHKSTKLTITGSGFDDAAATNAVSFSTGLGLYGAPTAPDVQAVSPTSLVVTFGDAVPFNSIGDSLLAVVTTNGEASGAPVVVATVAATPFLYAAETRLAPGTGIELRIYGEFLPAGAAVDVAVSSGTPPVVTATDVQATYIAVTLTIDDDNVGETLSASVSVDELVSNTVQVASVVATACGSVLFDDQFADFGALDSFDVQASECLFEPDTATLRLVPFGEETVALAGGVGAAWDHVVVDTRVSTADGSSDVERVGVLFRYSDGNNYYVAYLDNVNDLVVLGRVVAGTYTQITSTPVTIAADSWYDIQVRATASRIIVAVDDTDLIDTVDTSHATGTVGLYAHGILNPVYWDGVTVAQGCPTSLQAPVVADRAVTSSAVVQASLDVPADAPAYTSWSLYVADDAAFTSVALDVGSAGSVACTGPSVGFYTCAGVDTASGPTTVGIELVIGLDRNAGPVDVTPVLHLGASDAAPFVMPVLHIASTHSFSNAPIQVVVGEVHLLVEGSNFDRADDGQWAGGYNEAVLASSDGPLGFTIVDVQTNSLRLLLNAPLDADDIGSLALTLNDIAEPALATVYDKGVESDTASAIISVLDSTLTFDISLTGPPLFGETASVTCVSGTPAVGTVPGTALDYVLGDFATGQTVPFTPLSEGTTTVTCTASSGGHAGETAQVTIETRDYQVLIENIGDIAQGHTETINIGLSDEPLANVDITCTPSSAPHLSPSSSLVTAAPGAFQNLPIAITGNIVGSYTLTCSAAASGGLVGTEQSVDAIDVVDAMTLTTDTTAVLVGVSDIFVAGTFVHQSLGDYPAVSFVGGKTGTVSAVEADGIVITLDAPLGPGDVALELTLDDFEVDIFDVDGVAIGTVVAVAVSLAPGAHTTISTADPFDFTVTLSGRPDYGGSESVNCASDTAAVATVSAGAALVFDTDNWDSGLATSSSFVTNAGTAGIVCTGSGGATDGVAGTGDITYVIPDVSVTGGSSVESNSGPWDADVAIVGIPFGGTVTLDCISTDTDVATLAPASLTFSSPGVAQQVTLTQVAFGPVSVSCTARTESGFDGETDSTPFVVQNPPAITLTAVDATYIPTRTQILFTGTNVHTVTGDYPALSVTGLAGISTATVTAATETTLTVTLDQALGLGEIGATMALSAFEVAFSSVAQTPIGDVIAHDITSSLVELDLPPTYQETLTITLTSRPSADVDVQCVSDAPGTVSVTPTTPITVAVADFATPLDFTLETISTGLPVTITCTAVNGGYDASSAKETTVETYVPSISADGTDFYLSSAGIARVAINLDDPAFASVDVNCVTDDPSVATVSVGSTLTFVPADGTDAKDVTVAGVGGTGNVGTVTLTCTAEAEGGFTGVENVVVNFHVADPAILAPAALSGPKDGVIAVPVSLQASPSPDTTVRVSCAAASSLATITEDVDLSFTALTYTTAQNVYFLGSGSNGDVDVTCEVVTGFLGGYYGSEEITTTLSYIDTIAPIISGLPTTLLADSADVTVAVTVPANKEVVFDVSVTGSANAVVLSCTPTCVGFNAGTQQLSVVNDATTDYSLVLSPGAGLATGLQLRLAPASGADAAEFEAATAPFAVLGDVDVLAPPVEVEVGAEVTISLVIDTPGAGNVKEFRVSAIGEAGVSFSCNACAAAAFDATTKILTVDGDAFEASYDFQVTGVSPAAGGVVVQVRPIGAQTYVTTTVALDVTSTCFGVDALDTENVCSGIGACLGADTCDCDGFDADCSECAPGFANFPACSPVCTTSCDAQAICVDVDTCECLPGYTDNNGGSPGTSCTLARYLYADLVVAPQTAPGVVNPNERVSVTAVTASVPGDTVVYNWVQTAGPAIDFSTDLVDGLSTTSPHLLFRRHTLVNGATYTLRLDAQGDQRSVTFVVNAAPANGLLTVSAVAPTGDIIARQSTVTLEAVGFTDAEGDTPLEYRFFWNKGVGSSTRFPIRTWDATTTFAWTPPAKGEIFLYCEARDARGAITTPVGLDTTTITVLGDTSVTNVRQAITYADGLDGNVAATVADGLQALTEMIAVIGEQTALLPTSEDERADARLLAASIVENLRTLVDGQVSIQPVVGLQILQALNALADTAGDDLVGDTAATDALALAASVLDRLDVTDDNQDDAVSVAEDTLVLLDKFYCNDDVSVPNSAVADTRRSMINRLGDFTIEDGPAFVVESGDLAVTLRRTARGNADNNFAVKRSSSSSGFVSTVGSAVVGRFSAVSSFGMGTFADCRAPFPEFGASAAVSAFLYDGSGASLDQLVVSGFEDEPILVSVAILDGVNYDGGLIAYARSSYASEWSVVGLGAVSVVETNGVAHAQFTTSHLTDFAVTTGCDNADEGEGRGFLSPDTGLCACQSSYLTDAGTDCNVKNDGTGTCDFLPIVVGSNPGPEYDPRVISSSVSTDTLALSIERDFVLDGNVVEIKLNSPDADPVSTDCVYPGPNWTKLLDVADTPECVDGFAAAIPFSTLTTAGTDGCGFVRTDRAEDVLYEGSLSVVTLTPVDLLGDNTIVQRETYYDFALQLSLPTVVTFSVGDILVIGDDGLLPASALSEQRYDRSTGLASLTFITRSTWPLKLTTPDSVTVPPLLVHVGAVIEDASGCDESDVGAQCFQTWTIQVDPNGECVFDGPYALVDFGIACVSGAASCPLLGGEVASISAVVTSEDICGTLAIDTGIVDPADLGTLSIYEDDALSSGKTAFLTGDTVYFGVEIGVTPVAVDTAVISGVSVRNVAGGASVAFISGGTPTVVGNQYDATIESDLAFSFLIDGGVGGGIFDIDDERDGVTYVITADIALTYVDGTRARVRQTLPSFISPTVELSLAPPTIDGSDIGSDIDNGGSTGGSGSAADGDGGDKPGAGDGASVGNNAALGDVDGSDGNKPNSAITVVLIGAAVLFTVVLCVALVAMRKRSTVKSVDEQNAAGQTAADEAAATAVVPGPVPILLPAGAGNQPQQLSFTLTTNEAGQTTFSFAVPPAKSEAELVPSGRAGQLPPIETAHAAPSNATVSTPRVEAQ